MPVAATYTWGESESMIQIKVPLKGQSYSKVDIFVTECYLKISFPPYLLEVDLHGDIEPAHDGAHVRDGILTVRAKKKNGNCRLWGVLGRIVDRKCDAEVVSRRYRSIEQERKRQEELKERISLRRHEDERLALRCQMSLEEAERSRIEDLKAEEKQRAETEMYRTLEELAEKQHRGVANASAPMTAQPEPIRERDAQAVASTKTRDRQPATSSPSIEEESSIADEAVRVKAVDEVKERTQTEPIWDEACSSDGEGANVRTEGEGGAEAKLEPRGGVHEDTAARDTFDVNSASIDDLKEASYVPEPRTSAGVVPVAFTARLFPTPLRESKVADESAWIMKNRKHLSKNKALVGRIPAESEVAELIPTDVSETDPVWLKGRGDDLYRGGDFLGAINAYTSALDFDPEATGCLSNRAACHLRLGHVTACVTDCDAALLILQTVGDSGLSQAKILARRALAYRELGHYRPSLEDCRAALAFNPGDATLEEEIKRAEPLARYDDAKQQAAKQFASGDIAGACELYSVALAAVPSAPSCLSNRAACRLALGQHEQCIHDCDAALGILSDSVTSASSASVNAQQEPLASGPRAEAFSLALKAQIPPIGSEKRLQWILTTIVRRGRAYVEMGNFRSALKDYREASLLAPDDKDIAGDVQELELHVENIEAPLSQ